MKNTYEAIKPDYSDDISSGEILNEFTQAMAEGLDVAEYEEIFRNVSSLPQSEAKKKLSDALYEVTMKAEIRDGYRFDEPSDLDAIRKLRKKHDYEKRDLNKETLKEKIHGAWMGRVCGCLLGKPVEGIRSEDMKILLAQSGNFPMYRYINQADITDEIKEKCTFCLENKCFADVTHGMPIDDDTNYVVLYQKIIEEYGRDFTPRNVADAWLKYQPVTAYFTAERIAYINFLNGFRPPFSAMYKNPCREWIGAQIRGDYFGYINPGKTEEAAEMAFRDASVSHVKNGIYGEMFASAMIAAAAVTDNIEDIILAGLGEIPRTSRLYASVMSVVDDYKNAVDKNSVMARIHEEYDEHTGYGWCHTISNAMIVAAALLYGEGDFGKSLCMAVEACFDTDCNGATVGSVLGMRNGISSITEEWTGPVENTIHTAIFGLEKVKISDCAEKTLNHIQ